MCVIIGCIHMCVGCKCMGKCMHVWGYIYNVYA